MFDDPVDQAVLQCLLGAKEAIAFHVAVHLLDRPPGVVGVDLVDPLARLEDLPRVDLDVARLALEPGRRLVDQDAAVRQREALARRPAREQQRAHRHRDPAADRRHVRLDELHRVVDREAGVDRAARRVDVDRDVLVRVDGLEVQQLGDDEVRDLIVDRLAEEDDPLVEQAREDVVLALAAGAALDDGGDEGHGAREGSKVAVKRPVSVSAPRQRPDAMVASTTSEAGKYRGPLTLCPYPLYPSPRSRSATTTASSPSTRSISTCPTARSSVSSAPTAPARPR